MNGQFEIKIINQYWLGQQELDLCSHGEIYLRFGEMVLSDKKDGEWNISESALSMLRGVIRNFPCENNPDYYPEDMDFIENVQIFHCGCFMMFCPSNIGWDVKHNKDETVKLYNIRKNDGEIQIEKLEVTISRFEYANEVFKFATKAKELFRNSEKNLGDEELFEGQYQKFWREYDELLNFVSHSILNK